MTVPQPEFTYSAQVIRWVDGDTVDVVIDLGFHTRSHQRLRLYGIDTPERGQPGYTEATQTAEAMAPVGSTVVAKTYKTPEKYGRFMALIYIGHVSVNDVLVETGHAKAYGGGPR